MGLSLALPASAADGGGHEDAAARLFREGRALLREGRVAEGCDKFRASLELNRSPGTLLNVASCDRDQGDLVSAVAGFEAARAEAQSYPDAERRKLWTKAADDALTPLRPRLAEVRLVLPSGASLPSTWSVRMDGKPLRQSDDGRSPQNPGAHRLEVDAEGHPPYARDVRLTEGERLTLEVQLAPAPVAPLTPVAPVSTLAAPTEPPMREAPPAESQTSVLPTVLAIGGGVLTVAGLTAGVITWKRKQDLEARCPGPDCPNDEVDAAETLATVADVLVVSGVVLGVAGGAWLLWGGQSSEPSAELQAACAGVTSCRANLSVTF